MRRAVITIHPGLIEHLLNLPEDIRVRTVNADWITDSIHVMIEGDGLPVFAEHIPGAVPPSLNLTTEIVDGRLRVRL